MAKATKKPPNEDESQSQRFIETAREIEAAGGLSPTDAEKAFEELMAVAVQPKSEAI